MFWYSVRFITIYKTNEAINLYIFFKIFVYSIFYYHCVSNCHNVIKLRKKRMMILFVKLMRKSCLYKYIVFLNKGNLLQLRRKKPLIIGWSAQLWKRKKEPKITIGVYKKKTIKHLICQRMV